jgi:hypothetical protein
MSVTASSVRPPEPWPFDAVRAAVRRTRLVPDGYKSFACDASVAARKFAVTAPLLTALLDFGLSYRDGATGPMLDPLDLTNISTDLQLRNGYWSSTRLWARSLAAARRHSDPHYEFTFSVTCPRPGHAGPCSFSFHPLIEARTGAKQDSAGNFSFLARPVLDRHDFGAAFAPVVAEATRLRFHRLPHELYSDLAFLRDSGLANCQSATLRLLEVAAEHGLTARPVVGLFVSVPFSMRHVWIDVRVEDGWVPADPFFLHTLARWDVVSPADWPVSCSPRLAVVPLASPALMDLPVLLHGDEAAPWGKTVLTRLTEVSP